MFLGDINVLIIFFLFLITSLIVQTNTSLHLLLTAELLWITLYSLVTLAGLAYDNLNLLSLTFFFLIFSAVEFGVGLVLMLIQHLLTRTLNLDARGNQITKFSPHQTNTPFLNKIMFTLKI